jgi:hypothetical protein
MPIVLDGGTVEVALAYDANTPEDNRPAFVARYITALESVQYRKAVFAVNEERDEEKQLAMLKDALKIILTGVKNMGEMTLDDALNKLSEDEVWELSGAARASVHLSEKDKKKSRSASLSTGGNSAPDAKATSAAGLAN